MLPYNALEEVVKVCEHGNEKYERFNWVRPVAWSAYFDAAMRHMKAWYYEREDTTGDSNLNHLAHAATNLLFLLELQQKGIDTDDRPVFEMEHDYGQPI